LQKKTELIKKIKMKKILGMGNALTDILLQLKDERVLVELGYPKGSMQLINPEQVAGIRSKLDFSNAVMAAGGSASNTVNGIARLGGRAGFFGRVGRDEVGEFFEQDLRNNGVEPHLAYSESISGTCTVLVSSDGERTLCTHLGASAEIEASDLHPDMFAGYDFFHIEGYLVQNHDLIETAVKMAKEAGLTVSIDLASFNVVEAHFDFIQSIVREYVDIVFANEEEARSFTNMQPGDALIHMDNFCDIAIVKIGKDGSMIRTNKRNHFVDPFKADCIDTTGAGDLYAAGFLYGMALGYPLAKCGMIASYVSARVVEVIGAKMPGDVWSEINSKVAQM
jgi:sugar/nucleoside kinase (ribokinase family)